MKSLLSFFTLLALVVVSAPVVSADTAPDRTRAVITRSTDVEDRADRDRNTEQAADEPTNRTDGEEGGSGVVLDVSYDSDGNLVVNFNNGGNSGNANITITINGQTVSNSGNQTGDQEGGSIDGEDGEDGRDGSSQEESDEEESEESVTEEEETNNRYDSRDSRETFDRPSRR